MIVRPGTLIQVRNGFSQCHSEASGTDRNVPLSQIYVTRDKIRECPQMALCIPSQPVMIPHAFEVVLGYQRAAGILGQHSQVSEAAPLHVFPSVLGSRHTTLAEMLLGRVPGT